MSSAARSDPVAALIIAGGQGTRFWPLSRADRPKALFSLDGKSSLLADTIARTHPGIPREHIFVLVSAGQQAIFKHALKGLVPARNLLVEPEGRGTAVAIAYGAALIGDRLGGETVVAVMPADHFIAAASDFRHTLRDALRLAGGERAIVVIGVTPSRPEPGYGYQKIGRPVGCGFEVERFVEKPPMAVARRMVESGKYLWNAGIFVMSIATLGAELTTHAPALARAMSGFASMLPSARARAYRRLDFDSFDRVVAEKSRRVLTVRARFRWHDVGSWQGLWEARRGRRSNVLAGKVLALDADGVIARGSDRLMVLLGVEDLVAVDSGDAVLIARRSRSQDLRKVAPELKRRGFGRYL